MLGTNFISRHELAQGAELQRLRLPICGTNIRELGIVARRAGPELKRITV